jgi:hypothetical protein
VSALTVLFVVLAVVLTVPVYAFAVRRLLGLHLSPLRAWIGGLIALACASPIITAIGSSIAKHNGSWSLLPTAWFVILGVAIALLIGMLVLVVFEALVPSGALPGPVYLIRAWRKRVRRVRRYSQIGRILVQRGMLPYLRGTRRSELHTRDGRAALLDTLLREVMIEGVFHADPHPGNVILLVDCQLGLLDFGSVGWVDIRTARGPRSTCRTRGRRAQSRPGLAGTGPRSRSTCPPACGRPWG